MVGPVERHIKLINLAPELESTNIKIVSKAFVLALTSYSRLE